MSDQTTELTRKGEQTRAHILETALRLFAEKGYQGATMREIAAEAGCSLGLAYRYFSRKEDFVLAFYVQSADQLEGEVRGLPRGPLAVRFEQALRADIRRMEPYRGAFAALFGVALEPESEVAVLGERMAHIRERVWNTFLAVVEGSTDGPRGRQARDLATIFYAVHLGMVLFWLQDRTPGQRATDELIKMGKEMVGRLRRLLKLPPVSRPLARVARIIEPMFGPRR
jgi:AcrR family transcriptional regulator